MNGRHLSRKSGSVMVEFTLALSFLIPLFVGAWAFGYSFYMYSALENAVRNGGRYAATQKYDSATINPSPDFLTKVKKMTVYGDPAADDSASPVVPNLTTDNVNLTVAFDNHAPSGMTVSISGYSLITYMGRVTLNNKPYVWFPFTGMWGPPPL